MTSTWKFKAAVVMCLMVWGLPALSAEVPVNNPGWLRLSGAEKRQMVREMKSTGQLDADDVVVYRGPKNPASSQIFGKSMATIVDDIKQQKAALRQRGSK